MAKINETAAKMTIQVSSGAQLSGSVHGGQPGPTHCACNKITLSINNNNTEQNIFIFIQPF
jgi:hypothetical protein